MGLDMRPYCSTSPEDSTHVSEHAPACHSAGSSSDDTQETSSARRHRFVAAVRSRDSDTVGSRPDSSFQTAVPVKVSQAPPLAYDLAAVVHHTGSLDGGHYTAQCRHPANGQWHEFDDATVRDTAPAALSASAYVLFYVRQT
jgi:ubiquitin C-terminal hydrolase